MGSWMVKQSQQLKRVKWKGEKSKIYEGRGGPDRDINTAGGKSF
jgi:hypothetical protein